jgi:hypothetical protein
MSTTIVIKNSSQAGKVPDASALQTGELALNLKDQKLYSKDVDGNIFELSGRVYSVNGETGDVVLEVDDLDDVDTTGISTGDLLVYDNGTFKPIAPTGLDVSVDLNYTPAANSGTITNTAGDDAIIPLANGTNAGLFEAAEKTKLAGIEDGAQVNVPGETPSGGTADRPNSPTVGDLFYDTDLNALIYWNGTSWVEVGSGAIDPDDFVKLDDGGTKQTIKSAGLGLSNGTDENITLESSGAGTFAGNVTSKTSFVATAAGASGGLTVSAADDGSKDSVNSITRDNDGLHFVSDRAGSLAEEERKIDFALGSSTPSITFNHAGGAQFSADVQTTGGLIAGGDPTGGANIGTQANWSGIIRASRPAGNMFEGYVLGDTTATAQINVNGNTYFAGEMQTNGYYTERYLNAFQRKIGMGYTATINGSVEDFAFVCSDPAAQKLYFGVTLNGDGEFEGNVKANNVTFSADEEEGLEEINVRERLTKAKETFQELQVAVASSANFGELKAAMLVALEDYNA